MKHLKNLFPVLLCTLLLGLSSCKETNADRLRAMRGDWESIKNRPAFTLFEENGQYRVQPIERPTGELSKRKPIRFQNRTETCSSKRGFPSC